MIMPTQEYLQYKGNTYVIEGDCFGTELYWLKGDDTKEALHFPWSVMTPEDIVKLHTENLLGNSY